MLKRNAVRLLAIAVMVFLFLTAVLYQLEVFDFSFHPREHGSAETSGSSSSSPTQDSTGESGTSDDYSLQFADALRAATNISRIGAGVLTGGEPVSFVFEKLSELVPEGYELSYADYDSDGTMRLCLLEPDISLPAYGSYEITELVFYSEAKDDYSVPVGKKRIELKNGPGVRLYMGYILTESDGEQCVYRWDGTLLLRKFYDFLTPALARDTEGHPLFLQEDDSYYYFDENGTLVSSDYQEETDGRGLFFDYPPDYGAGDNDILRFSLRTTITSLITAAPDPETVPPQTEPPETELPVTVSPEEPEVTPPAETEPAITEPADTGPADTEPEETDPAEPEPEDTEPEDTEPEDTESTDTDPEEPEPENTDPADTAPTDTEPEEPETTDTEPIETEPAEPEPAETIAPPETEPTEPAEETTVLPEETEPSEPAETPSETPAETAGTAESSDTGPDGDAALLNFTEGPEETAESEPVEIPPETPDFSDTDPVETEPAVTNPEETTPEETTPAETTPEVTTPPPQIISTEEYRFAYGYNPWYLLTGYHYSRMFNFSEGRGVSFWYDQVLSVVNEYGQEDWRFTRQTYYWNENGRLAYSIYTEPLLRGLASVGSYYFDRGYLRVRQLDTDAYYGNPDYLIGQYDLLLDKSGNRFPIPEGYDLVGYSDGVLLLSRDGKYGYYSTECGWIAQPIYTFARPFAEGLGVIGFQNGIKGVIDTKGNVVIPFDYTDISQVSSGVIAAYSAETGWRFFGKVRKPAVAEG